MSGKHRQSVAAARRLLATVAVVLVIFTVAVVARHTVWSCGQVACRMVP